MCPGLCTRNTDTGPGILPPRPQYPTVQHTAGLGGAGGVLAPYRIELLPRSIGCCENQRQLCRMQNCVKWYLREASQSPQDRKFPDESSCSKVLSYFLKFHLFSHKPLANHRLP